MPKKNRRGRPRLYKKVAKPISSNVEELLKGPSYPLELVTTKFGGMKLALHDNCYEFHFNRNGFKFWKCSEHTSGCEARVVSKDKMVFPMETKHNHEKKPRVLISTTAFVQSRSANIGALVVATCVAPAPEVKTTEKKVVCLNQQLATAAKVKSEPALKDKLKQRFAAIGLNSSK